MDFQAICFSFQLITRNLQLFLNQLQSKEPLFKLETVLSAPEIGLSPPAGDLFKMMVQSMRDTVERSVDDVFYLYFHPNSISSLEYLFNRRSDKRTNYSKVGKCRKDQLLSLAFVRIWASWPNQSLMMEDNFLLESLSCLLLKDERDIIRRGKISFRLVHFTNELPSLRGCKYSKNPQNRNYFLRNIRLILRNL